MPEDNSFGGNEDQDYAKTNRARQMIIFNLEIMKKKKEEQKLQ